jgi:sortase A
MQSNKLQSRLKGNLADGGLADRYRSRTLAEGDPLTRIQIPKIGLDSVVVEGISLSALKAGAGHYPQTPLPGEVGNVGIAGHRTTYGRPFNRMDELRTGDTIILTTPVGRFTYSVARDPFIVAPTDLSVLDKTSDGELTLTSCHPKGSARQRIIVRAKLVRSEPVKASPAKKVA